MRIGIAIRACGLLFSVVGCVATTPTPIDPATRIPGARRGPVDRDCRREEGRALRGRFRHVVVVVLENQDLATVDRVPYVKTELNSRSATFGHLDGLFHPSFPNYLAMVSGRLIPTDRDNPLPRPDPGPFIGDRIEAVNYAEGYSESADASTACDFEPSVPCRRFASKHVPFLSFASGCKSVRNAAEFAVARLPQYTFYSPDLDHDGHDPVISPARGRTKAFCWLEGFLRPFQTGDRFLDDTLVIVTFDESSIGLPGLFFPIHSNRIYTAFLGNGVRAGYRSPHPYNPFNDLRTVEDIFGVEPIGDEDCVARPILDVFTDPGAGGSVGTS